MLPVVINFINLFLHIRVHSVWTVISLQQSTNKAHTNTSFISFRYRINNILSDSSHSKIWQIEARIRCPRSWFRLGPWSPPSCLGTCPPEINSMKDLCSYKCTHFFLQSLFCFIKIILNTTLFRFQKKQEKKVMIQDKQDVFVKYKCP